MSKYADRVRFIDGHSMWGALPKRARREMAKLYGRRDRVKKTLTETDEELNILLCRYGRPDLQIVRPYNRDAVVIARQQGANDAVQHTDLQTRP